MSTETVKPTAAFPVKKLVMLLLTIAVFLFSGLFQDHSSE